MSVIVELDRTELLLWTLLRKFESLALTQYELHDLPLATEQKRALLSLLMTRAPSDEALESTTLSSPVSHLMADAAGTDEAHTLVVQGLLLEVMGRTLYQTFEANTSASFTTRAMCLSGLEASISNLEKLPLLFAEKIGKGDNLFQVFMTASESVIKHLDELGEGLDQHFSTRFGISYTDLIAEVVAELIPLCTELGMDRRQVMGHLTSILMGS